MCRGSSDPAFNTQLGEKAHQEKKPCCKVGLNREKAAAKAQPAMLACPLIPQVVCLSKAVSYSELPLPQAVFFVECSPCTPNDTTGFNGAEKFLSPVSRAQYNNSTDMFVVSKPPALPFAEKCNTVTDRTRCCGCANRDYVAVLGFFTILYVLLEHISFLLSDQQQPYASDGDCTFWLHSFILYSIQSHIVFIHHGFSSIR